MIATSARLFAERGYQATSMQDLTEATGLAAGGLYHYIGSKEQLLFRICDELLEPLLERARAIVAREAPATEHLHELLRAWLAHIATHREHMLVFAQQRHAIETRPAVARSAPPAQGVREDPRRRARTRRAGRDDDLRRPRC